MARERFFIASKAALSNEETLQTVRECHQNQEKVTFVMEVTSKFDEWDMEEYVANFRKLRIDKLHLDVSKDYDTQPTYNQILQLQGALEHFCTALGIDEENDWQIFDFEGMTIEFAFILE